jgi:hypothetical protein
LPDGKRVKCPECGNIFTSPGFVEPEEDRPRKKSGAKRPENAVPKKSGTSRPSEKKRAVDDDEDQGIYSYLGGQDEDKPQQINYAPDVGIKDLRGPAQAAVMAPSNYIVLIGALSCLGSIAIICVMIWPFIFQEHVVDHVAELEKLPQYRGKETSVPKERKDLKADELEIVEDKTREVVMKNTMTAIAYVFILIYGGVMIIGAVSMQNLESHKWGVASSLMLLLPFGSAGISGLVFGLFQILLGMVFDEDWMIKLYAGVFGGAAYILSILVGMWSLRVLRSKKVIQGFEFVPE